jgi:S1-C subfamily serine protease
VKATGRDTYDLGAAELRQAMDHGGQILAEAWSTVRPMVSLDEGITFRIQSPVADGVLGPRGFQVNNPNMAERVGIQMGDVILAVNGQPIKGFGDLFRLYQQVRRDTRISMVTLDLDRQGQSLSKTFRIR